MCPVPTTKHHVCSLSGAEGKKQINVYSNSYAGNKTFCAGNRANIMFIEFPLPGAKHIMFMTFPYAGDKTKYVYGVVCAGEKTLRLLCF